MTASDAVKEIMKKTDSDLKYLEDYADVGSKSDICNKLNRTQDMKVGTLIKLLECMGYRLVAVNDEESDEIIIDE